MTDEKAIGRALLAEGGSGGADAAAGAIRRARRRVGLWAVLTLAAWTVVAAYCVLSTYSFLVWIYPKLAQYAMSEEPLRLDGDFVRILARCILVSNIIWPALLLVAAVLTVVFVLKSRRATLIQIQASLAEISEQIRAMARDGK